MAIKGFTNNPHGRPKGTPNKATKELRRTFQAFIENNIENLQADFDQLEPKDRFQVMEKLLQYVLPKEKPSSDFEKTKIVVSRTPPPVIMVYPSEAEN